MRGSLEEYGRIFAKSYVIAFACGVDKVFYSVSKVPASASSHRRQAALIDVNGGKRPTYYALKTLILKLNEQVRMIVDSPFFNGQPPLRRRF